MSDNKGNNQKPDLISVCVCTYKRPEMLASALNGVLGQQKDPAFDWEIVVIDNDEHRSAEAVVRKIQSSNNSRIIYDCEPEKNISLARNRAIANSSGNLIAFMDDDERPAGNWLKKLTGTLKQYDAAGVLGPVLPDFPESAPKWIKNCNIFDRKRFPTGTVLTERHTRTGNALLDRSTFPESESCFDPSFGLTGGEDVDFFSKQMKNKHVYIWCDEAIVYETIPPERWPIRFHFQKFLRIGTINGEKLRALGIHGIVPFLKNLISTAVWFLASLILLPFGRAVWVKPALKLTYSISSCLSYCGISFLRYRK
jgi:succinoglycan biosynthesis protein ExoM